MIKKERNPVDVIDLRKRAEHKAGTSGYLAAEVLTPDQLKQTLHELQVHQIELEMQNEELRHTQEELEVSRARYFDLYDLAPVGYCTISEKHIIIEANLTLADLLGETRSALINTSLSRYIFPADQDIFHTLSRQLVYNGGVQTSELRMIPQNGNTPFWVKMIVSVYREPTGSLVYHIIISDITDRILIKETLQKNQDKLQMLFQILPVGLSVLDKDRLVILSNPELEKILAVPGDGLHKNNFAERRYLHADGTPMSPEEFPSIRASRERKSVEDIEVGIVKEDGTMIWTSVSAVPVPFDEWDVVVSTVDITHRKLAEEALRKIRDGLEVQVNERTAELLVANEMKLLGQLTSGVAHEVRNPLNGILAIMGALSKELADEFRFEPYIKHMRNQVTRLSVLMDDLLILGRPLHEENLSEISMVSLIEKNLASCLQTIPSSKSSVRLIKPEFMEPCMVKVDTTSMSQLIINLIENAINHSPTGTEIICSVDRQKNDTVIFIVKDRGTGIPEDILPKIFDPFFTTRKGGTGLGLSIVRRIVENHQGTIKAYNNADGPGATFEVVFPLAKK